MKPYWLITIILLAGCAPAPQEVKIPLKPPQASPQASQITYLPQRTPHQNKRLVAPPVGPTRRWLALATVVRGNAQRALDEKLWEDLQFKKDTYATIQKMIAISNEATIEDSKTVLKKFRWGMELMDPDNLRETIKILDTYENGS